MENYQDLIEKLTPRVREILTPIGGHKIYHLEGNCWEHTLLVMQGMGNDSLYQLLGLLHDIGKSKFYERDAEGWYTYPGHAKGGADMLHEFIPTTHPQYQLLYWVIANHIKTLFFCKSKCLDKDMAKLDATIPAGVDHKLAWHMLLILGIADIKGSYTIESEQANDKRNIAKLEAMKARL